MSGQTYVYYGCAAAWFDKSVSARLLEIAANSALKSGVEIHCGTPAPEKCPINTRIKQNTTDLEMNFLFAQEIVTLCLGLELGRVQRDVVAFIPSLERRVLLKSVFAYSTVENAADIFLELTTLPTYTTTAAMMDILEAIQSDVQKQKEEGAVNNFRTVVEFREFPSTAHTTTDVSATLSNCCLRVKRLVRAVFEAAADALNNLTPLKRKPYLAQVTVWDAKLKRGSYAKTSTFRHVDGLSFYTEVASGNVHFERGDNKKVLRAYLHSRSAKLSARFYHRQRSRHRLQARMHRRRNKPPMTRCWRPKPRRIGGDILHPWGIMGSMTTRCDGGYVM
ncbi:hypothetical protein GQ600_11447 [Phytophthora cactorum]|nr:hypothetical protein GQ600_11447 [Phytophthora cactorum]